MRTICSLLFVVGAAAAQSLLHHTFTDGPSGWTVLGQGSVNAAAGVLEFSYEVKPKQFAFAVLPAPREAARLKRIRFRVKTDHDTAVAMLLSEKKPGGGNYTATFWAPAGAWQTIELAPGDFNAADGPNDPVDADGKLDLDQLDGIGIIDLAHFFAAQPENPEFPLIVDRSTGAHTLQLADFEMLGSVGQARPAMTIDRFDRGYVEWITMGGVKLQLAASGNPLSMNALEAAYEQTQGHYGILLHRLSHLDLGQAKGLAFDIASKTDATVIVTLELKNGHRFNQTIYPPGDREVFHVKLSFSDFTGDGKLDPAQLKSLALVDVSAAEGGGGQSNTLWIGKVECVTN